MIKIGDEVSVVDSELGPVMKFYDGTIVEIHDKLLEQAE